jgi:phosphatidylinositol-3-phosphatase
VLTSDLAQENNMPLSARLAALLFLLGADICVAAEQSSPKIRHVIVIVMENTNAEKSGSAPYVYGNGEDAPYINTVLMPRYAHAVNYTDPMPLGIPSEPHYVYLEAGTNSFPDFTFGEGIAGDLDPSKLRSTASTDHLTAQIEAANGRVTWMTYQEGLSDKTGACPVNSDHGTHYGAKHNPFVFFQDVSGNPPSKTNGYCAAHTRPYAALASDMAADRVANYVFVTPDLCHDMHDKCGNKSRVRNGDDWLKSELPAMIDWVNRRNGVIFLAWDEGHESRKLPFLAIGPMVRNGYAGPVIYDHGSLIKTVERIFGLPYLATVTGKNDMSGLFKPGAFH